MDMKKKRMVKCICCNTLYPYSPHPFTCDECMKKAVLGLADIIYHDRGEIEKLMNELVDTMLKNNHNLK